MHLIHLEMKCLNISARVPLDTWYAAARWCRNKGLPDVRSSRGHQALFTAALRGHGAGDS